MRRANAAGTTADDARRVASAPATYARRRRTGRTPHPAPPLRIALYNVTTTTKIGGVETFVWELARHLAAAGHAVDVIGGSGGGGLSGTPVPGVRVRRAPFIRREWLRRLPLVSRLYGPTKLMERLSFGLTTLPWLLRGDYDILHIQKPFDLPVGALVRRLTRGRTQARLRLPRARLLRRRSALDRRGRCDRLVQRHQRRRDRGALRPRRRASSTTASTPTASCRARAPTPRYARWRARLTGGAGAPGPPPGEPDGALEGGRVRDRGAGPPAHRARAGAGPGWRWPVSRRSGAAGGGLGVADRVVFLGDVPHEAMPDLFPAVDIVLGTSFVNETFGISLCEALACERAGDRLRLRRLPRGRAPRRDRPARPAARPRRPRRRDRYACWPIPHAAPPSPSPDAATSPPASPGPPSSSGSWRPMRKRRAMKYASMTDE